mmetsp:Transcript_50465/g.131105  ORF Transcript_50465/g.131105 Transcript_50465/m.131105 type:complete len:239 (+) Transcript_50465:1016-1732(+)
MGGIEHELVLTICVRVHRRHAGDGAAVGRRQGSPATRPVHGVPNLKLVLVVHRQDLLVVAFATKRVPDATSRPRLLLDHGVGGHRLQAPKLGALHAVLHEAPILANGEEPWPLLSRPGEAEPHDGSPVRLVLRGVHPLLGVVLVVVPVRVAVQADTPVCVRERQITAVGAECGVRDAVARLAERGDLGEILRLEQLAVAVGEAHRQQLAVGGELQYVGHQLLEDFHQMQGPRVVVPHV